MNPLLFAQAGAVGTIGHWLIIAIVIAGIIGIALVVARYAGITVPPFIFTVMWIILAVVVGVVAIKFLMQMV
jgi:hypothetical protein